MLEKNTRIIKKSFLKDFSWYFLGSFIPLLIGFIKTPIFTRHFSKEDYGYLGLVTITFSYLGMILFSWIGSCIWRYYSKYHVDGKLKNLYSNLIVLYIAGSLIISVIGVVWYLMAKDSLVKELILYSLIYVILNQFFQFYMVVIRLKGQAKFFTTFQSIRAFVGILIALYLVFKLELNISALVASLVLLDALVIGILLIHNPAKLSFNLSLTSMTIIKQLLRYGAVGLILNLSLFAITTADRYIIAWFSTLDNVGIYDQVYKLAQISIVALVTIFFNTVNPTLLKELETNYDHSVGLIRKYIKSFVLLGMPMVIYLSLYSKDIATLLLGKEFRVGYTIMPYVFIGAFIYGISNFYELRLKFSESLKKLSIIAISIAVLNVILTIIFVKLFNYQWAAITTAFCYFILLLTFHLNDKEILKVSLKNSYLYLSIGIVLLLQIFIFIFLSRNYDISIGYKLALGLVFILSYYLIFKRHIKQLELPIN